MKHQDALDQLARETQRAKHRIAFERGLRAGWLLLVAVGAWAALALFGAHEALPFLAQSLTAIFALLLFAYLVVQARRAWHAPTEDEARARLAADSRLDLGAFDALRDQPSRYDPFSVALWNRERDRALERAGEARAGPPRPRLDEVDPYKLRYALLLALVAGVVIAGPRAGDRLENAFLPDPGPLLGDRAMAIEAWVAPAEYTHAAPISLSDLVGQRVATPPSVEATVRVTGPVGAPHLEFDGAGGHRETVFLRAADGAWEAHLALPSEGTLKIVRFHTRARWHIVPGADARPIAAFGAPIAALPNEQATISWRARDDYGVRRLVLRTVPIHPPEGLTHADPVDTDLETPGGDPREAEGESDVDLAAHPYAGMEVEARIVAIDALGQEGASEPLRFTLPEKVFLQPLAQAAIEIRRHILTDRRAYRPEPRYQRRTIPAGDILLGNQRIEIRDYDNPSPLTRAPDGIRRAARLLDAVTMEPQDGYFRDLAVFLGFRLARSQLADARTIDQTDLAADTLWRTALRAEYGGAADARRALEEAQRQLSGALANGAPQERIRQLMEALRRATQNYMQALVQEALRNGERQNSEDTQEQTSISAQDIQDMLRQVQQLSEQGRNEEAQRLLQTLASILANMDVHLEQAQSGQGQQSEDQNMQQSMDQLSQAMGDQRALRDDTQQQQQQEGQGGSGGNQQGGEGGDDLAQRQAQIRAGLEAAEHTADQAGAAPSPDLNAAGQAMQQAENALRSGDLDGARASQDIALDRLRAGAAALAAEMRERGQRGQHAGNDGDRGGDRDPLGRVTGGDDGSGTRLPTRIDPARAREIFDEIRRRAQDPNRPETEREYLQRLMNRFGDS